VVRDAVRKQMGGAAASAEIADQVAERLHGEVGSILDVLADLNARVDQLEAFEKGRR